MMTGPGSGGFGSALAEVTDTELMARLEDGDDRALAEVYRRHGWRVIAVAGAVLRDREAAEDVCREVFVQLARHPERFDDGGRGTLSACLVVTAHRRAVDRLRGDAVEGDGIASSTAARIWSAVDTLPVREAEAVRLACFGGTTCREVARLLEVAEGTVKRRIRRGLRQLRAELVEQGIITVT
jgi:RNA polymerase sigma-70 factor, ECF subfamily